MNPAAPVLPDRPPSLPDIIGRAPAWQALLARARKAAASQLPVVISGESGTGKELVARYLHDHSVRAASNYVVVNCAALPRDLLESELFGYERGAFTGAREAHAGWFQAAHGGTLVLDEIGEMPIELQPKLLRALEGGLITRLGSRRGQFVNVRLVASTNRNLRRECEAGRFRTDLYHRLSGISLALPSLRQRPEDLPLLVEHFARCAAREQGQRSDAPVRPSETTLRRLQAYPWPGNVRELRHLVWRTVALAGLPLCEETLLAELGTAAPFPVATPSPWAGASRAAEESPAQLVRAPGGFVEVSGKTLAQVEAEVIRHHLQAAQGNRRKAARSLGISRTTLYERLRASGREDTGASGQP